MMLDPLSIDSRRIFIDSKRQKKLEHHCMPLSHPTRKALPLRGKEYRTIPLSAHQSLFLQAGHRSRHRNMSDPQALGDIDYPSFSVVPNQVIDDLNVVLGQLSCPSLAGSSVLLCRAPLGRAWLS
jgi:hypothetical protein